MSQNMSRTLSTLPTELRQEILLTTVLRVKGSVIHRAKAQSGNTCDTLLALFPETAWKLYVEPGDDDFEPEFSELPEVWKFEAEDYGDTELGTTLQTLIATSHSVNEDMRFVLSKLENIKQKERHRWLVVGTHHSEQHHDFAVTSEVLVEFGFMTQEAFEKLELSFLMDNHTIMATIKDLDLDLGVIARAKQQLEQRLQAQAILSSSGRNAP